MNMGLFFRVLDFNATEVTTYDKFEIVPMDKDEYEKAYITTNGKYGTMKDISNLFKDRKLNIVYIEDISEERKDTHESVFQYHTDLLNTLQDIIDVYEGQQNALIICDVLEVEDSNLFNATQFLGFTTLEGLLTRPGDKILLYVNNLVGIRFFELGNNIWS